MKPWVESFWSFLLDLAKITFATLIIGKFITPSIVDYAVLASGIIISLLLIIASWQVSKHNRGKRYE